MKFNRNYTISIEDNQGNFLEIKPPFTIDFNIQRNSYGTSPNPFQFNIYNLSELSRNRIRKDVWQTDEYRRLVFSAGYGEDIKVVTAGNIRSCQSFREGVDFKTSIQGFDGGSAFINAQSNHSFSRRIPKRDVIFRIMRDLNKYNVEIGAVGDFEGEFTRSSSFSGKTIERLNELTDDYFFIDNEKAYALNSNEYVEAEIIQVTQDNGLLETPKREETYLEFEMLFEPALQIGTLINLRAEGNKAYNGFHKVQKLFHSGVISEVVSGNAKTIVGLLNGNATEQFMGIRRMT